MYQGARKRNSSSQNHDAGDCPLPQLEGCHGSDLISDIGQSNIEGTESDLNLNFVGRTAVHHPVKPFVSLHPQAVGVGQYLQKHCIMYGLFPGQNVSSGGRTDGDFTPLLIRFCPAGLLAQPPFHGDLPGGSGAELISSGDSATPSTAGLATDRALGRLR
jgi:hypothetical protein